MRTRMACLMLACVVLGGCGKGPVDSEIPDENTLVIFYSVGPLCIHALDWLADMEAQHPDLAVQRRLIHEAGETALFNEMKAQFDESQGLSTSFGLLPIIFFRGQAFSGFDDDVGAALEALIASSGGSG